MTISIFVTTLLIEFVFNRGIDSYILCIVEV